MGNLSDIGHVLHSLGTCLNGSFALCRGLRGHASHVSRWMGRQGFDGMAEEAQAYSLCLPGRGLKNASCPCLSLTTASAELHILPLALSVFPWWIHLWHYGSTICWSEESCRVGFPENSMASGAQRPVFKSPFHLPVSWSSQCTSLCRRFCLLCKMRITVPTTWIVRNGGLF